MDERIAVMTITPALMMGNWKEDGRLLAACREHRFPPVFSTAYPSIMPMAAGGIIRRLENVPPPFCLSVNRSITADRAMVIHEEKIRNSFSEAAFYII